MVATVGACTSADRRDLCPLPHFEEVSVGKVKPSRSVLRRLGRRGAVGLLANQCVDAVNSSALGGNCAPKIGRPSAAQIKSHDGILSAVHAMGPPPPDLHPQGAFEALRGSTVYEDPSSTVAPFNDALVSLPDSSNIPVSLAELYGTGGDKYVNDFIHSSVLEPSEAASRVVDAGLQGPYMDTVLRHNPKLYAKFVRRLSAARMVEFRSSAIESVGLFFVRKNDGRL